MIKAIETVSKENSVEYLSRRVSREMDFQDIDPNVAKAEEDVKEETKNGNSPSSEKVEDTKDSQVTSQNSNQNKPPKIAVARWKKAVKNASKSKEVESERQDDHIVPKDEDVKDQQIDAEVDVEDSSKDNCVTSKQNDNENNDVTPVDNPTSIEGNNDEINRNFEKGAEYSEENNERKNTRGSKTSLDSIEKDIKEDTSSSTNSLEKYSAPVQDTEKISANEDLNRRSSVNNNDEQVNDPDVEREEKPGNLPSFGLGSCTSRKSIKDTGSNEQTNESNNDTKLDKQGSEDIIEPSENGGA